MNYTPPTEAAMTAAKAFMARHETASFSPDGEGGLFVELDIDLENSRDADYGDDYDEPYYDDSLADRAADLYCDYWG